MGRGGEGGGEGGGELGTEGERRWGGGQDGWMSGGDGRWRWCVGRAEEHRGRGWLGRGEMILMVILQDTKGWYVVSCSDAELAASGLEDDGLGVVGISSPFLHIHIRCSYVGGSIA